MNERFDEAGLQRIAARMLRDHADRDDAIQEMWLASLQQAAPEEQETTGWRVNVLRNRAMRIWDQRRRRQIAEAAAAANAHVRETAEELDRRSMRELLQVTLDKLPGPQAEVIRARFFEDLSLEEIARRMGAPAGTIRARLARGLADMRRRLDERTGDPRLTALALIRSFDWTPANVAAKTGWLLPSSAILAASLVAVLGVTLAVFRLVRGGDRNVGADAVPNPRLVARASSPERRADPLDPDVQFREPVTVPPSTGSQVVAADAIPSPHPEAPAASVLAGDEMELTIMGFDDAGKPASGMMAKAWLPADRSLPFVGPAGPSGRLTIRVGADHRWKYFWGSMQDTALESLLQDGTYVKVSVRCAGAVRHADLHVPFMPGAKRAIEVRFDSRPFHLNARVLDRAGAALSEVVATTIVRKEWESEDLVQCLSDDSRVSDGGGAFQFDDLSPGTVNLKLTKVGFVPMVIDLSSIPGGLIERTFVLDRAVPVVGVVRDREGRPVQGARVMPERDRQVPGSWVLTQPDGSFTIASLPPGAHRVSALGPAGTPLEDDVSTETLVLVDREVVWNPVLAPSGVLTVQVLDELGWPVAGQMVLFRLQEGVGPQDWWDILPTDEEGFARANKVPDANIRVELRAGQGDAFKTLALVPFRVFEDLRPQAEPYVLKLEDGDRTGGSVQGVLARVDGSPCLEARLSVLGPLSRGPDVCTLSEGTFELPQLPRGDYVLYATLPFGGVGSTTFHLDPGQSLDLGVWRLPAPGTLRVTDRWPPVDALGRPVQTLLVVRVPGHGEAAWMINESTSSPLSGEFELLPGEFEFQHVVAGRTVDARRVVVHSGATSELDLVPPFDPGTPFVPEFKNARDQ